MRLLLVGEVPGGVQDWPGWTAVAAGDAREAAGLLDELRPDALVVWSGGWGPSWVASLPSEQRPFVLLVGPLNDKNVAPDEWVGSLENTDELPLRVRLAVLRGRERRRTA